MLITLPHLDHGKARPSLQQKQNVSAVASDAEPSVADDMEENGWRLLEPPPQLFQVPEDASPEIRDIIEAFGAHCMVIHQSAQQVDDYWAGDDFGVDTLAKQLQSVPGAWMSDDESLDATEAEHVPRTALEKGKWVVRVSNLAERSSQSIAKLLHSKTLSRAAGKSDAVQGESGTVECASCFEEGKASTFAHLACQHWYCKECLVGLVLNAMLTENQWPPSCCRIELPRKVILVHLSRKQAKAFSEKEAEFNTPAKERWYCSRPTCARWFKPQNHGSHVTCPHCQHEMCPHCRGTRHDGTSECPQDTSLEALKREAGVEGWTPCPECHALIELMKGCRHITCRCSHQFCWVCSARWHTCTCTEKDKDRKLRKIHKRREKYRKEEAAAAAAQQAAAAREAAERKEREQRVLEEKAFAEGFEAVRVSAITSYFAALRDELDELHDSQCMAILEAQQADKDAMHNAEQEAAALEDDVFVALHGDVVPLQHLDLDVELALRQRINKLRHIVRRYQQSLDMRSAFEGHWIDLAATERAALLRDARDYLIASGGEAPGMQYPSEYRDGQTYPSDSDGEMVVYGRVLKGLIRSMSRMRTPP